MATTKKADLDPARGALEWAEEQACAWLQRQGFDDVKVAPHPQFGRARVVGADVIARVRFSNVPIGLQEVKELHAVALASGRRAFAFSVAGYTDDAAAWADESDIVLLRLVLDAQAANDAGRRFTRAPGSNRSHRSVELLQPGDRVAAADGGYRVVDRVQTRKAKSKLLHFVVSFVDGSEMELELGKSVQLWQPPSP